MQINLSSEPWTRKCGPTAADLTAAETRAAVLRSSCLSPADWLNPQSRVTATDRRCWESMR